MSSAPLKFQQNFGSGKLSSDTKKTISVHAPINFELKPNKAPRAEGLEKNIITAANMAGIAKDVIVGAYTGKKHNSPGDPTERLSVRLTVKRDTKDQPPTKEISVHAYVNHNGEEAADGPVRFSDRSIQILYEDALEKAGLYDQYKAERDLMVSKLREDEVQKYGKNLTEREKKEDIFKKAKQGAGGKEKIEPKGNK